MILIVLSMEYIWIRVINRSLRFCVHLRNANFKILYQKVYKEQNDKSGLLQQLTSFQQHASNVMLVEEREKVKLKFPIKLHYKVQL